jgi:uncharacterized protein YlbG (UPF0298 family)
VLLTSVPVMLTSKTKIFQSLYVDLTHFHKHLPKTNYFKCFKSVSVSLDFFNTCSYFFDKVHVVETIFLETKGLKRKLQRY